MPSTQSVGQLQPAWHIHKASYSPKPYFPSINYFSCIPDRQPGTPRAAGSVSSDAGGQISWIPSFRWMPEDNPPIPHSESGPVIPISCFVPPWFLWISKWNLTPANLSRLSRVPWPFWTPKSMHCAPRGIWLQVLCIAQMSFLNEDSGKKKKKKKRIQKNLTSHLRKERRNAENEPTNIKTQEAAF